MPSWTKELPQSEGYYWWRYGSGEEAFPRIVKIYQTLTGLRMTFMGTAHVEEPGRTPGEFWPIPLTPPR
jgi:hypothetical protein